jgi:phospholipid/cholesterol/gamma-HCH transport system substrate-binding protein
VIRLTAGGVEADLDVSDSAPPIPARLHAVVADLSAVGEQYVDLRPATAVGPFLADGSVIPQRDTQLPLPVTGLLTSMDTMATSLPLGSLRALTDELATGFADQGSNLRAIVDGNGALVRAAYATIPQTTTLISDARTVLATQIAESGALDSFGANALLLARQLDQSNASLRQLFIGGPQAAAQVANLLTESNPGLGVLIANLLTTSELTLTRGQELDELLSAFPAVVAIGSTVISGKGARFGVALTFFAPLPCTSGYGSTVYRNGLDTSPAPPLNTAARCACPRTAAQTSADRPTPPQAAACRPPRSLGSPSFWGSHREGRRQQPSDSEREVTSMVNSPASRRAAWTLLLATLVFAAWSGWSWLSAPRVSSNAQARDQALQAGEQAVLNFNTLDYRRVARGLNLWEQSSTGALRGEIAASRSAFEQEIRQSNTVSTSTVLDAALTALNLRAGTASVIVAVAVTVTPAHGAAAVKYSRLAGQLTRTAHGWKLSALSQVPVEAAVAGRAPSG